MQVSSEGIAPGLVTAGHVPDDGPGVVARWKELQ
jgi:hypothetical protein